jgi:hypothetical protein
LGFVDSSHNIYTEYGFMELAFNIAKCVAWAPGLESGDDWKQWQLGNKILGTELKLPELKAIPAMQRRRLSPFAKVALHCALEASAHERSDIHSVFSSRHGDLHRTTALIEDVASGSDLSPTKFGLSVHNAVAGLYSIYTGNRAPISAVAAGEASFIAGLIDCVAKLHANKLERILYVYSDLIVPDCYCSYVNDEISIGIGLLIEAKNSTNIHYQLTTNGITEDDNKKYQPLDFMDFYYNETNTWQAQINQQQWNLTRINQ